MLHDLTAPERALRHPSRYSRRLLETQRAPALESDGLSRAAFHYALEPGSQVVAFSEAEHAAILEAQEFIQSRYAARGLSLPVEKPKTILSGLCSQNGYSGAADFFPRVAIRHPAFGEDLPHEARVALWVHEFGHLASLRRWLTLARGSLPLERLRHVQAAERLSLNATGWMIFDHQSGAQSFRSLEEYSASLDEGAYLRSRGFSERFMPTSLILGARQADELGILTVAAKILEPILAKASGADGLRYEDLPAGFSFSIPAMTISYQRDTMVHANTYDSLVAGLDLLAREVFPQLRAVDARELFRSEVVRLHNSGEMRELLGTIRSSLGTHALQILARMGAVRQGEMSSASVTMKLFWLYIHAGALEPAEREHTRHCLVTALRRVNANHLRYRERAKSVQEKRGLVSRALHHFKEGDWQRGVEVFHEARVLGLDLPIECGAQLLQNLQSTLSERHLKHLEDLLVFHRVFSRETIAAAKAMTVTPATPCHPGNTPRTDSQGT